MDDSRRRFCTAVGLGLVGATLPACGDSSTCNAVDAGQLACGSQAVSLGMQLADVPMDSATFFDLTFTHIWLCRDAQGVYALDAECTHLGCDAKPNTIGDAAPTPQAPVSGLSGGFTCHCHGATYDPNGTHPTAPAPSPLRHYLVCATVGGEAYVDTQQVVDACTRYKL
jgi:Rieske Fe-S protein